MQLETDATSESERDLTLVSSMRQRVRTTQGLLHREAMRRTQRANTMVVLSCVTVLALVKVFYEVLSH